MELCLLDNKEFHNSCRSPLLLSNSFGSAENKHLEAFNNSQTQQSPALTITPALEN